MSNIENNENFPSVLPKLTHSVNSSGRLGAYVNPHTCSCDGCRDFLAGNTGVEEPPGLSNLPPPSALELHRQTAEPPRTPGGTPDCSPISNTSSLAQRMNGVPFPSMFSPLPQRSNGGGIAPPISIALGPTPTGLGNWRAFVEGFRTSRWEETEEQEQEHSSLCHCGPCIGEHENTGMPLHLRDEILGHLTDYLSMLEKHRKVVASKMDLYAFLLEDASVRLRFDAFEKKIKALKETLKMLE
jgi:hypothetical protein